MIRLLALLLLALIGAAGASAQGLSRRPTSSRRTSWPSRARSRAGEPFTIGIRMVMRPHWHVYWRNPGDSGLSPEVAWSLPQGFTAGAIQWPTPSRIPVAHLVNFGFEGETVLLAEVTPPAVLPPGKAVTLTAKLTYLVCERECIPGSADLKLSVPVAAPGTSTGSSATNILLFEDARAALPVPSPWPVKLTSEGDRLVLTADAPGLKPDAIRQPAFFPYSETAIENAAPQTLTIDDKGFRLSLARATPGEPAPTELPGVFTFDEQTADGTVQRSYAIGDAPAASPGGAIRGRQRPRRDRRRPRKA